MPRKRDNMLQGRSKGCLAGHSPQIDDALRISVHIVSETDLGVLMSERPELKVQQEDENEWFVSCIVLRKEDIR